MLAYRNIVVGTDFSAGSEQGVATAVRAANRFGAKRLHLVHVVHAAPKIRASLDPDADIGAAARSAIQTAQRRLEAMPLPETEAEVLREVRVGAPARELAQAAEAHHSDLVVVARRGHSPLARLVLGSVANALIRVAHCPVLVVGEGADADARFDNVLAAVDLSPVSRLVVEHAMAVARAYAGEVHVLSLFEHPLLSAPEVLLGGEGLEEARERHREAVSALVRRVPRGGVRVEIEVMRKAPVAPTIIDVAEKGGAELVVMGTSGRNAWHRMILGSAANHVLLRAPCAVLVVPPLARVSAEEPEEVLAASPALGGNSPC